MLEISVGWCILHDGTEFTLLSNGDGPTIPGRSPCTPPSLSTPPSLFGAVLYNGLGFVHMTDYAALVVFSLVISEAVAPFGWLFRMSSRRDEFQADRFAVEASANGHDLREALIALNKQNLSSPGSHRLYRHYYNSHPALRERLKAIRAHAKRSDLPLKQESTDESPTALDS